MKRLAALTFLLLALAISSFGQIPDSTFRFNFTGTGAQTGQANLSSASFTPSNAWAITLSTTGTLSATVSFQTSPDNVTFTAVPNTACTSPFLPPCVTAGANPFTGTQGLLKLVAYGAYVRVNITGTTGSGTGSVTVYGYKGTSASLGSGSGGGGGGGGGTPGGTNGELQYNMAGAFGGAGNGGAGSSFARPSGMIEVGPYFTTPSGGIGSFQNFLIHAASFRSSAWVKTNVTVSSTDTNPPDGSALNADLFSTGDSGAASTTVAGGFLQQCVDTGSAMTGRTFTLSVWARYPTTAVAPVFTILSTTPSTATATAVSPTTLWQRLSVTGTFGTDTDTHVCAKFAPNGAGSGLVYLWGAQLEEGDIPTVFHNSDFLAQAVRSYGLTLADNQGGPVLFNIGDNRSQTQNDAFIVGNGNDLGASSGGLVFGNNNTVTGSGFGFAIGTNLSPAGRSMMIGQSNAASKPTNPLANSVCIIAGSATGDAATDAICQLWAVPGPTGETGVVRLGNRASTPGTCGSGNYLKGSTYFDTVLNVNFVCYGDNVWFAENRPVTLAFAGLALLSVNGMPAYCSDCTVTSGIDNTCTNGGTGANAQRINGAFKCTQ